MKRALALVMLVVFGGASALADARLPPAKLVDTMIGRLRTVAKCGTPKEKIWCLAAAGWAGGTAPDWPKGNHVFLGVSVGLQRELPDDDLLSGEVTLSVLAVQDGKNALVTDVLPEDPAEKRLVGAAIEQVAGVLHGKAATAQIPPALLKYANSLPPTANHALAKAGTEWRFGGVSQATLRKAGPFWLVVEIPNDGPEGIYVGIYTDQVMAAPK
jgi:hypothetical protein